MKFPFRYVAIGVSSILTGFASDESSASVINGTNGALRILGSGQYLNVPSSPSLNLTNAITIELWWRIDGNEATPGIEITKRGDSPDGGSNNGYVLNGHPYQYLNGGIFGQNTNLVSPIPAGGYDWHAFAWTFDGSVSTLYFDGSLIQQIAYSGTMGITNNDLTFGIGHEASGQWNGGTDEGFYDEIRIWNVARTAGEIAADYNKPMVGTESNLVGLWNFDNLNGSDSSRHDNNGVAMNGAQFVHVSTVPLPAAFWSGAGMLGMLGITRLFRKSRTRIFSA